MNNKHTSQLLDQLRHQLLNRIEHLYDLQDKLPDNVEESIIKGIDDELDRIQNIFKLLKKGKL